MSDFGVLIKFKKNSGSFNKEDLAKIVSGLEQVVNPKDFPSNITNGNFLKLKEWDKGEYVSLITEYYLDQNEEELMDFAEEEDLEQAKDIIEKLKIILNDSIDMSAHLEEW